MTNRVFVDTSAFVSFMDDKDPYYDEALQTFRLVQQKNVEIITTDFVIDETITVVQSRVGHAAAVSAGNYILNSTVITLYWLDTDLKLKAWEYFKRHRDKRYSFTDCTSFVLMKDMGIRHYIAFDEHFRQAGFLRFR